MKEEAPEDIEEVKAEVEEVALEDARGGGDLVVTLWLKDRKAWSGPEPRPTAQCGNPTRCMKRLTVGTLPIPPLLRRRRWHMSPFVGHFAVFSVTRSETKVRGWPGSTQQWHGHGSARRGNPSPPSSKQLIALTCRKQNFYGPKGCLETHRELYFLHWEEKGWVKPHRSSRKLERIPQ